MLRELVADGPVTFAAAAVFGLLSSVHCIGMCGGIAAAQGAGREKKLQAVLIYGLGRLLSYSTVGFVIGLTGSLLDMNKNLRALIPILCGLITIVIGLQMLGLLRWLSTGAKRCENRFVRKLMQLGPFVVGLLTGVMPCGTLQTVQAAALSSGSALTGCGIMAAFALTSSPALCGVGMLSGFLTARTRRLITVLSALVILFMGVRMLVKGLIRMGVITI